MIFAHTDVFVKNAFNKSASSAVKDVCVSPDNSSKDMSTRNACCGASARNARRTYEAAGNSDEVVSHLW
jgi:hypothetical protein